MWASPSPTPRATTSELEEARAQCAAGAGARQAGRGNCREPARPWICLWRGRLLRAGLLDRALEFYRDAGAAVRHARRRRRAGARPSSIKATSTPILAGSTRRKHVWIAPRRCGQVSVTGESRRSPSVAKGTTRSAARQLSDGAESVPAGADLAGADGRRGLGGKQSDRDCPRLSRHGRNRSRRSSTGSALCISSRPPGSRSSPSKSLCHLGATYLAARAITRSR